MKYSDVEYYGKKEEIGGCYIYRKINHDKFILKQIGRHSPDGFQWGYGGSGPAETALCILLDFVKLFNIKDIDGDFVEQNYQKFKWDFISSIKGDLKINGNDINNWLKDVKNN